MTPRAFLLFFALPLACSTRPVTPPFAFCPPAAFANCTEAKCVKKADGSGYTCTCFEDGRYSATANQGSQASSCVVAKGGKLQSRFHPIASYQECISPDSDTREWAWCLGVTCTADPKGPQCDCTAVPAGIPRFPYIITTNAYSPEACRIGLTGMFWSSATPQLSAQVTSFLQTQPGLEHLKQPIVLTPAHPGKAQ